MNLSSITDNTPAFSDILPTPQPSKSSDLGIGFRRSLYFHIALAIFIVAQTLIFPSKIVTHTHTLRVDLVGLPTLLKKDLAQASKKKPTQPLAESLKNAAEAAQAIKPTINPPAPAPAAPPPKELPAENERVFDAKKIIEKPIAKPIEKLASKTAQKTKDLLKKNQSALARIKSLAKIGVLDTPTHSAKPKLSAQASLDIHIPIYGNKISAGSSLASDAKESDEENYLDILRDRLQENWTLPVWIARQKLSAQIQVFVDSRGRLQNFRMVKSSGNPQFDDAVRRSVQKSQPFPPPPQSIATLISGEGVLIGFPL